MNPEDKRVIKTKREIRSALLKILEEKPLSEITVKEIRRNQVRLGISAPDNMRIYRKELLVRDAARENMESDAEGGADARE